MTDRVLIAGAGPTGLVLALALARNRVDVRIVDKNAGPGEASRAMAVHARTLEFYRQLGFAEDVAGRGIRVEQLHLREGGRERVRFRIGDFGKDLSPYPFVLSFPQDEHERLLVGKLQDAGVRVEWNTELLAFDDDGERVQATLRKQGAEETVEAAYLCGCDGAHSTVRRKLDLGFPGGTYDQMFYVADVEATGEAASRDFTMCLGANLFCGVFPIRTSGMFRLIGIVPPELSGRNSIGLKDIQPFVESLAPIHIRKENWFSTYHVHHRVADHFRKGNVFIAGDAGHVHSPAGGQGMNTGIGDALNLAWKLAAVLRGRASGRLLETYEPERIAFARLLVSTTDKAFTGISSSGRGGRIFRQHVVPYLLPLLFRLPPLRKAAFRLLSQTRINYRASMLSSGKVGGIHGGDRLPWVESLQNFNPLETLDWQIHVYGAAGRPLVTRAAARNLPVHEFTWRPEARKAGLARDALYLVRPDGYIALVSREQDITRMERLLDEFAIRSGPLRNFA